MPTVNTRTPADVVGGSAGARRVSFRRVIILGTLFVTLCKYIHTDSWTNIYKNKTTTIIIFMGHNLLK